MSSPSLQKTAALSALMHLSVFILSILIFRQSSHVVIPSPYIVSLVSPSTVRKARHVASKTLPVFKKTAVKKVKKPLVSRDAYAVKKLQKDIIARKRIEERISELQAKKKIERIVRLRSIISLKDAAKENRQPDEGQNAIPGASKGSLIDNYYLKISGEIWQEWVYPDLGEKNLETIVFIKIAKDGTLAVQGIKKSSGNALFDRSALKAIAKASPVSAPPYEMEIGIRFYP